MARWHLFLNVKSLKLVDQLIYIDSNISSTESDVNVHIGKVLPAIDTLSTIWKSDLANKLKQEYFQTVVFSVLLYDCTT